ncbi:MAG: tetratricopeptide repeat protein, partial [Xanthomonadales bacterium]|nr:tetratricopeptide repeat protein [Xanthomonadales bacterium]
MNEKVNGDQEVGAPGDREVHRHYDRAKAAFGGGDLPEAARHCAEALEREPDFLPALELGGVIACNQGDLATGIERFRRLTELVPDNPGAHFNLGNALLNAGRPKDALPVLGEADELEPGNPGVRVTMGICRRRMGEYEAAEALLKSALERSPRNLAALNALGATYAEQHRYEDAHRVFKEAVSIEPRSPQLRQNVGSMLLEMAHYAEAADEFRAVLTLDSRDADARAGLGAALAGRGDYDEAMHHFRRALRHAPDHGRALYGLIDTLEHEGRIAEAQELLEPALEAKPGDANLLFLKARLARRNGDDEAAAEAVSAAEAAGVPASLEDRFFAEAGAIHDRAGNRERAMLAFTRANAATEKRWRAASPGPNAFMARVERIARALEQRETDGDAAAAGDLGAVDLPIFLVGFPRSGTTLLGQMCNAHPALVAV